MTIAAHLLACLELGLGVFIVAQPRAGAMLFGLRDWRTASTVRFRLLGVRNLLFALGLTRAAASRDGRTLKSAAMILAVVPLADLAYVRLCRGSRASMILHALGAVALVGVGACARRKLSPLELG